MRTLAIALAGLFAVGAIGAATIAMVPTGEGTPVDSIRVDAPAGVAPIPARTASPSPPPTAPLRGTPAPTRPAPADQRGVPQPPPPVLQAPANRGGDDDSDDDGDDDGGDDDGDD